MKKGLFGSFSWGAFFGIFLVLIVPSVNAQTVVGEYFWTVQNSVLYRSPDPATACKEHVATNSAYAYHGISAQSATAYWCQATKPPSTTPTNYSNIIRAQCTGTTPYFDDAKNTCVKDKPEEPPPSCDAGVTGSGTWYRGPVNGPHINVPFTGASNGQCEINIYDVSECYAATDGGAYCVYKWRQTGAAKGAGAPGTPGAGPVPSPPPAKDGGRQDVPPQSSPGGCPAGTVQGGFDSSGIPICIGTGSNPPNKPAPPPKSETTKSEPMPDGGTKTTTTVTTKNTDGSTTTETTVTIVQPDGTKLTDTNKNVSPTPSGGAGRDDSKREDEKYDLCKQNPMLTICRNSSVSGTCGTISCQGDAIQCATLRNIAVMECRQVEELDKLKALPQYGLGNSILSGSDPQQGAIDAALKGTEVDLSQQSISDAAFLNSAICLADRSFVVSGKTIPISFGKLCNAMLPLRYLVMAVCWIVAYRIVSRVVVNG